MTLNQEQSLAATAPTKGVIRINAGAGTGKTKTLLARLNHLYDASPDSRGRMILLAFNRSVVEELKERIEQHVLPAAAGLTEVFTTYGLAFRTVQQNFLKLHFTGFPQVPKDWKVKKDLYEIGKKITSRFEEVHAAQLLAAESFRVANGDKDYEMYFRRLFSAQNPLRSLKNTVNEATLLHIAEQAYQKRLLNNEITYGDMLRRALDLPEEVYEDLNIRHVLVDEAQDLNFLQHQFIQRLAKYAISTTFVGDTAQAIYAFNGARPDLFESVPTSYNAKDYCLETNYRSTEPIISVANNILEIPAMKTPLRLKANNKESGSPVILFKENDQVVFWLQTLLKSNVDPSKIAILYRAKIHTFELERQLSTNNIPYTCVGGSIFEHPVINSVLAYFRLFLQKPTLEDWIVVNQHIKMLGSKLAEPSFRKEPGAPWRANLSQDDFLSRQLNLFKNLQKRMEQLEELFYTDKSVAKTSINNGNLLVQNGFSGFLTSTILTTILQWLKPRWFEVMDQDSENEREYLDMISFIEALAKQNPSPRDFLNVCSRNQTDSDQTGVTLITIHKSKGLEWPYVGLWNVGHGSFPRNENDPEELRLFYVAVTRARDQLVVFPNQHGISNFVKGIVPDTISELNNLLSG